MLRKCICINYGEFKREHVNDHLMVKQGDKFHYKLAIYGYLIQHNGTYFYIDNEKFKYHFTDLQQKRKNILTELLK